MPDYRNLTPAQIVDLYKSQDLDKLEFSLIRKDLEGGGVSEDDIQIVLRSVDREKTKQLKRQEKQSQKKFFVYLGSGLLIGGILLAVMLWNMGWVSGISIVAILGGILTLTMGLSKS